MKTIEWKETYSVGFQEIDDQHKRLISMINDLAETLDPGHVFDTVMKMYAYADEHFDMEEEIMRHIDYPDIAKHIEAHNLFRQKTTELAGLDYTQPDNDLAVFKFLNKWFIDHILKMDMAYKNYNPAIYEMSLN